MIEAFLKSLRRWYESRISIPFGVRAFIGNILWCTPARDQQLTLTAPSQSISDITVTVADFRPVLRFQHWKQGEDFKDQWKLPHYEVIVELNKFQIRKGARTAIDKSPVFSNEWNVYEKLDEHEALYELRDLFLASAFYNPIRKEHFREIAPPVRNHEESHPVLEQEQKETLPAT